MADNVPGQRHDRTALIVYGSETGNSQDVADNLGRMAERLHFVTRVSEMDALEIVCPFQSPAPSRTMQHGLIRIIEYTAEILACYFRRFNYWTRRIPSKLSEVLEKSSQEAIASWMSQSRAFHHLWSWRQLLSEVYILNACKYMYLLMFKDSTGRPVNSISASSSWEQKKSIHEARLMNSMMKGQ